MKKALLLLSAITIVVISNATTYTVLNTNDAGVGSLRAAIDSINSDMSASFAVPHVIDASAINDTIVIDSAFAVIDNFVVINGPTSGSPLVIDAQEMYEVFNTSGNLITLKLQYLTIINGNTLSSGGAIMIEAGDYVELKYCNINNCYATVYGGAIENEGTLYIDNCVFENDSSQFSGSCINNLNAGWASINNSVFENGFTGSGGAICTLYGTAYIENCDFIENFSGVGGGALYNDEGIIVVANSRFDQNSAAFSSAYYSYLSVADTIRNCTFTQNYSITSNGNGTVNSESSNMYIENSTFSKNFSYAQGGALNVQGNTTHVNHCTFWGNVALNDGGAISVVLGDTLWLENSIVVGNICDTANAFIGLDIYGIIAGGGHNIIGDTAGVDYKASVNDIVDVMFDTVLDTTLQNNGGTTNTHAIFNCGPAIDNANNNNPTYDQRGMARYGKAADIGAFEAQQVVDFSVNPAEDTLCSIDPYITLSASPLGGLFSGPGININIFDPANANIGWNVIIYTYTDSNNCVITDKDSVFVDVCTDVQLAVNSRQLAVYPNPTTGIFTLSDVNVGAQIIITDVLGNEIFKTKPLTQNSQLDLSQQPQGVYFVKVISNKQQQTFRLIKN